MNYTQIGKRIKEARTAKGMTQEYLAEKLGIDPSFVSRIENGHNKASLETYVNICLILDTSLDNLTHDIIPAANRNIAEQKFHNYVRQLNQYQIEYLMNSIKTFVEYSNKYDKNRT